MHNIVVADRPSGKVSVEFENHGEDILPSMHGDIFCDARLSGSSDDDEKPQEPIKAHCAVIAASSTQRANWLSSYAKKLNSRSLYIVNNDHHRVVLMPDIAHYDLKKSMRQLYLGGGGQVLTNMHHDDNFTDIELLGTKVDSRHYVFKPIKAHCTVLAAYSSYLSAKCEIVFDGNNKTKLGGGGPQISLPIAHDALGLMKKLMYTGQLVIDTGNVVDNITLLYDCIFGAEYFGLNDLTAALNLAVKALRQ